MLLESSVLRMSSRSKRCARAQLHSRNRDRVPVWSRSHHLVKAIYHETFHDGKQLSLLLKYVLELELSFYIVANYTTRELCCLCCSLKVAALEVLIAGYVCCDPTYSVTKAHPEKKATAAL